MFQWLATECGSLGPSWQVFLISAVLGLPVTESELDAEEWNGTEMSEFANVPRRLREEGELP